VENRCSTLNWKVGLVRTCGSANGPTYRFVWLWISSDAMKSYRQFYIDGKWVDPSQAQDFLVVDPATEEPIATISLGGAADVDRAVAAAKRAFESY
jgi:hypothetical protein